MRVAQYVDFPTYKKNKSFQREFWDQVWSESSFESLVSQLTINPIYWRLRELLKKDNKILEAGCGFGQWVWHLSSLGYQVIGVDIASNTIKKLKMKYPKLDVRIADVTNLPFKDEVFDVYLSFGVIEHFEEGPDLVFSEAKGVLKKGGLLFLTVPYLNIFRLIRFGLLSKKKGQFYQYLYSKDEIISKIDDNGFLISRVGNYDFLSAVFRDFPFLAKVFQKLRNFKQIMNETNQKLSLNTGSKRPAFLIQKLLYKLDSYVILIEAHKI